MRRDFLISLPIRSVTKFNAVNQFDHLTGLARVESQVVRIHAPIIRKDELILCIAGHATRLASGALAFDCKDTDHKARSLSSFGESDMKATIHSREGSRGIVILDTCFAATFAELRHRARARGGLEPPICDRVHGNVLCMAEDEHCLQTGWLSFI